MKTVIVLMSLALLGACSHTSNKSSARSIANVADSISCTGEIFKFEKKRGELQKVAFDKVENQVIELQGTTPISVLKDKDIEMKVLRGSSMSQSLGVYLTIKGQTIVFYGDDHGKQVMVASYKAKKGRVKSGYELKCKSITE